MDERGSPQLRFAFPRPGPGLKAVLFVIAGLGLAFAATNTWLPSVARLFMWLVVLPNEVPVWQNAWRLLTAGFVAGPSILGIVFSCLYLYFLSPDLETRWGARRFIAFLVASSAFGFILALIGNLLPIGHPMFHPSVLYGPSVMGTAVTIAWARMNADSRIFFLFFPVSGRVLLWLTLAFCVLGFIDPSLHPSGVLAPWGGVAMGYLASGSPSPLRRVWLQIKLAFYRKQSRALLEQSLGPERPTTRRRPGAPPLRVVSGGLEDELKKRKPPKDKRYLN